MEDVPGRSPSECRVRPHILSLFDFSMLLPLLYSLHSTLATSYLHFSTLSTSVCFHFYSCLFSLHFFAPFNSFCLNFSTLLSLLYSLLLSSLLWLLSLLPLVLLYSTLLFPTLYMRLPFTPPYVSTSIHVRRLYSSLFHFPRFPTCQTSSPFAFLLSLLPCCDKIDASEVSLLNFLWPGVEQIPIHVQIKMVLLNQVDLLYIGCHVFLVPCGSS